MPISENVTIPSFTFTKAADMSSRNMKIRRDRAECWNVKFVTIQRDVKIGDKGIWRGKSNIHGSIWNIIQNDAIMDTNLILWKIFLLWERERLGPSVWEYWWWWPQEQKPGRREKYWEEGGQGLPARPRGAEYAGSWDPGSQTLLVGQTLFVNRWNSA